MLGFTKEQMDIISDFEDFSPTLEKDFLTPPYANTLINHYTSAGGLLGILSNQKLRFTEYAYLNDNTEGSYIFDYLDWHLHKNESNYPKGFIDAIFRLLEMPPYNEIYDINCKYYFLCCFSGNSDSLPMWNYYTKTPSKAGYNIQFEYRNLYNAIYNLHASTDGLYFEGYKVMYSPKEQEAFLFNILKYVLKVWQQTTDNFIIRVFLNYLNSVRFAFKHSAFEPEDEIRFVIKMSNKFYREIELNAEPKDKLINFYERDGIFVPHIEVPFQKKDISAIKLSPLNKDHSAQESVLLLLDRFNYDKRNIKIGYSDIPLRF